MKIRIPITLCILVNLMLLSCKNDSFNEPKISLDSYVIEDGFEIKVVASEPFIEAPVSMSFDNQGRMWVVEMKGYMQTLDGLSESIPNGTISILEDRDNDGITDHSKIFLEDLVLPRALAHVYDGLLYAEPPKLWFVTIENDLPKNKILVDSLYADGGNVEHQPNGLMMHTDNWIYNAKSNFRYQRKNGKWSKKPTSYRGQWGITKDDFGRLYFNNNSTQLLGDYVLPNTTIKNQFYKPKSTLSKRLTNNQRVYPLHATSVNRGYVNGVLDKDSILINVTSACGPLIYRGATFPESYYQNAFVCAPEANLIKRNILSFRKDQVIANQAWDDKEFLASTDEGFRPVNLFNGPDGNMYIVDMHRGIIQDKAYLSPYLKEQLTIKKLDTIIGMGRILKVSPENSILSESFDLEQLSTQSLVLLLENPNGWIRDRAQQLLIHQNFSNTTSLIKDLIANSNNSLTQIHGLYVLDGIEGLNFEILHNISTKSNNSNIIAHSLLLLEKFAKQDRVNKMIALYESLMGKKNKEIDLYISLSLGNWIIESPESFFPILTEILTIYKDNSIFKDAILSSLRNHEDAFINFNLKENQNISASLNKTLQEIVKNKNELKRNPIFENTRVNTDSRTAGYNLFKSICAACHGMGGDGITGVAPPLSKSEYVTESPERLASIILHGMTGPLHVNGNRYEFNGTMPGLVNNQSISNEDVLSIIQYLHNAFTTQGKKISLEKIEALRSQKPKDGSLFTESELLEIK